MRRVAVTAALAVAVFLVAAALTLDRGFGVFVLFWLVLSLLVAALLAAATWAATWRRRWFDRLTLVAVSWLALVLTAVTVAVPQTAAGRAEARSLGFGYPLHFAQSDMSFFTPPSYPQAYRFNPWENPTHFDGVRFALSTLLVYGALLAFLALGARVAHTAYAARSVRSAGPSA